jgi:G3E family GTPase
MMDRALPMPVPVTVMTGFLGAGKTTLLNRLLKDPLLSDSIVIVNEFGEIGLDHLFIETRDDGMILIASGCLCCTIRGDLVDTLDDLMKKRDTGKISHFQRIVIETTGLADPAPILQSLLSHPYLAARYALDGVVTLVDAANGSSTLDHHMEAVKQAAVADRIVLTKSDLVDDPSALIKRLLALNPAAPVLDAMKGDATASALIGTGPFNIALKISDVARWLNAEAYHDDHHHHDHHHDHNHDGPEGRNAHDVNRHDAHIRAFCLTTDDAIPSSAFDMFLSLLRSAHGEKMLRMKGIVKLAETPERPIILHGVQHVFHPPIALAGWPDDDHRTRLVFITKDLEQSFVEGLWNAFLGRPGIDTPDRSAMLDNPLSLRRE